MFIYYYFVLNNLDGKIKGKIKTLSHVTGKGLFKLINFIKTYLAMSSAGSSPAAIIPANAAPNAACNAWPSSAVIPAGT